MYTFDSEIRDQAYQFFVQEALEFLQTLETGLLNLRQDHNTPRVHDLMRAAHSIKGGAASVGLTTIQALFHRLEDCLRALYSEDVVFDASLEQAFLLAYDCVSVPLIAQIDTDHCDEEAALEAAESVFAQLEERLGDALQGDAALPTSAELGIDIVTAIFGGDVVEGLQRMESTLTLADPAAVEAELRAQVEVFAGMGELLNLPGFVAIAHTTLAALQVHPTNGRGIGQVALADFRAGQAAVMAGDRSQGGSPSSALQQMAAPRIAPLRADPIDQSIELMMNPGLATNADGFRPTAGDRAAEGLGPIGGLPLELNAAAFTDIENFFATSAADPGDADPWMVADFSPSEFNLDEFNPDEFNPDDFNPDDFSSLDFGLLPVGLPVTASALLETQREWSETIGNPQPLVIYSFTQPAPSELEVDFWASEPDDLNAQLSTQFSTQLSAQLNVPIAEAQWPIGDCQSSAEPHLAEPPSTAREFLQIAAAADLDALFDPLSQDPLTADFTHLNAFFDAALIEEEETSPSFPSADLGPIGERYGDPLESDRPDWDQIEGEPTGFLSPYPLGLTSLERQTPLLGFQIEELDPALARIDIGLIGKPSDDDDTEMELVLSETSEILMLSVTAVSQFNPALEPIAVEPIAVKLVATESISVEPIAVEPIAVEPIAIELILAEPIVAESIAAKSTAIEPIAVEPLTEPAEQANDRRLSPDRRSAKKAPKSTPLAQPQALTGSSVRVDLNRLERINNLVGELVTQENSAVLQIQQLQSVIHTSLQRFSQVDQMAKNLSTWNERSHHQRASLALASAGIKAIHSHDPQITHSDINAIVAATPDVDAFDALQMDSYSDLYTMVQEVIEAIAQVDESMRDVTLLTQQSQHTQRRKQQTLKHIRNDLLWARMLPLGDLLQRFPRMIHELSTQHHKQVQIKLSGTQTLVDKSILQSLYDPLVHLLRNAFDHGVELPDARIDQGKPAQATIEIRAFHRGNQTYIEVVDDGRGIDADRVRAKIVERQLLSAAAAQALSTEALYEYLFTPGFSTASQVSDLSGRGVGLDAVQLQIKQLKGAVIITSTPGQGTTFTLRLPLTLTIANLLVFSIQSHLLALPVDTLLSIVSVPASAIQTLQNGQFYPWQDELVALYPPDLFLQHYPLLHQHRDPFKAMPLPQKEGQITLLMIEGEDQVMALPIDQILQEQELVIKPFGGAIAAPTYLYGCTILGNGSLVPVIDGQALISRPLPVAPADYGNDTADLVPPSVVSPSVAPSGRLPIILVVDDSLTTRQTLAMTLQKSGYQTLLAKDGREALEQLEREPQIQAVFCDVEMPRMNGFEFLTQCRQQYTKAQLPVIMLTSRSGDKHRQIAQYMGASSYLTKPYLEHELLSTLQNHLNAPIL